jgi:ATP-dependent RNA helicase SUPV3L1/SUV3
VTVLPQHPDRRRKRNAARDLATRADDRAAARIEKLAQQSWV